MESLDLNVLPAMIPPPGVVPNFVDPDSEAPLAIALGVPILFMILTSLALLARLFTKFKIIHQIHTEDCMNGSRNSCASADE